MMKKKSLIAFIAVIVILVIWCVTQYNGIITKEESVSTAWGNVEVQYQRRADLIPNLVNTVKGYATHEQETLNGVVAARAKATQITVDPADLTSEKLAALAITENYPQLKANENFSELQAQLEGTENRISESRRIFNNTVQEYNLAIRRFPGNIVAGLFGYEKKAKFEAAEGSEKAPEVKF